MAMKQDALGSHGQSYRFRTPEGQAEFTAAYDRMLAQWPVPYESVLVPTRFGATHVLTSGPQGGPPIVLLHTATTASTIWRPNAGALSQAHRLFLVDIVGLPNKSSDQRGLRSRADAVEWLVDLLDGLGLERPVLGGLSLGGWLSLLCATRQPARVRGIVAIAPGGLARPRLVSAARGLMNLGVMVVNPTRQGIAEFWRWISADGAWVEDGLVEQTYLAAKHFRAPLRFLRPTGLRDDELRAIRVPVLLLEGEREPFYDPAAALARARRLIPHVEGELVPGTGHMAAVERPDAVNQRILEFLERHP